MALFHLESKFHSRKVRGSDEAKSISSIVAYRHCFALDGFDYTHKNGFVTSFMMIPEQVLQASLNNENLVKFFDEEAREEIKNTIQNGDCVSLWKAIEAKEKRKDSQLCEELIISLQHELPLEENIKNLKSLINEHYISKGKVADICIHNSGDNLHAHVLLTQRALESISIDLNTMKPVYEFGNKIRDQHFNKGFKLDQITPVREMWANLCNASFEAAGLEERISHESIKVQCEKALTKGDFVKAAELSYEPAKYIPRAESYQAKAKREAEAEAARLHNEREQKRKRLEEEMIEMKVLAPEMETEMVLKPIIYSFEDQLKLRRENRIKEIAENVARYIKDRANKYSRYIRKATTRANEIIETTRLVVRNQRQRMVTEIYRNNNIQTASIYREHSQNIGKQSSKLENDTRNKRFSSIEEAITILTEHKDYKAVRQVSNFIKDNINKIRDKEEFKPLLEAAKEFERIEQEKYVSAMRYNDSNRLVNVLKSKTATTEEKEQAAQAIELGAKNHNEYKGASKYLEKVRSSDSKLKDIENKVDKKLNNNERFKNNPFYKSNQINFKYTPYGYKN